MCVKCGIENSLRDVDLENDLHGKMNIAAMSIRRGSCHVELLSVVDDCDPELCDLWSRGGQWPVWCVGGRWWVGEGKQVSQSG